MTLPRASWGEGRGGEGEGRGGEERGYNLPVHS